MTQNDAWRYCENLAPTEAEKALAGACPSALLTIEEFRRKAGELKTALAVAGHPAGLG